MTYSYDRTAARGAESFSDFYENISFKASQAIKDLDEGYVGTADYMGIAYFWDMEYKFDLRDASPKQRRAVHEALLKAGLDVNGESPEHATIIQKIIG